MADDRTSTAVNGRAAVVDLIYLGFTLQLLLPGDRKSTRLNSSHSQISNAVFCLKTKYLPSLCSAKKSWLGGVSVIFGSPFQDSSALRRARIWWRYGEHPRIAPS